MSDPRDVDPNESDDSARPRAPRTAWWWLAVVLSGLMVLVLGITVVVSAVKAAEKDARRDAPATPAPYPQQPPPPWAVPPDDALPLDNDEGDVEQVTAFFGQLRATLRDPNGTVEDLIDWSDMVSDLPDDLLIPPALDDGDEPNATWFALTIIQGETSQWKKWNWDKVNVRRVVRRAGGTVVDAVVWHPTADGKVAKRRWSFSPQPDGFRAIGWEDLRTGMTAKDRTHARTCGSLSPSVRRQRQSQLDDVNAVHRLIDERNWEQARRSVDRLRTIRFDGELQYPVDLAEARLAFAHRLSSQGEWDQDLAVEILEELVTRHPERLAAYFWLAEVHLLGEEYPRVIEVCDALISVTGDDPDALGMRATARHALLQPEEAKADFDAALALDPFQPRALNWLREEADAAGKKAIAAKLANAPDPQGLFDALTEWATDDRDWPAVQALAEKYRSVRPKDPRWGWPLVESLVRQGQPEKAADPLKQALTLTAPADRERLILQFTNAMIETRKADAVYAVIPPAQAPVAFRRLAEHHETIRGRRASTPPAEVKPELVKPLVELIDAHRKLHPTDPRLALHDGRLKIDQKEYDKAVEVLAPAVATAKPTNEAELDWQSGYLPLLSELLLAQYKRGKAIDAYKELKHDPYAFDELAERYITDRDGRGLSALLDERAKDRLRKVDEQFWRAEVDRLTGKHAAAAARYKSYLGSTNADEMMHGRRAVVGRLRCLVAGGEAATAAGELDTTSFANDLALELRALVLAKAGRVADAEQLLRDRLANGAWWVGRLYTDEDLGPLLRGPDFADFRKDYPPPDTNK